MGSVCVSMTCAIQKMQDSFLKKWNPAYVGCDLFLSSFWPPCSHYSSPQDACLISLLTIALPGHMGAAGAAWDSLVPGTAQARSRGVTSTSEVTPEWAGRHSQWFNKATRQHSYTKAPRPLCRDLCDKFSFSCPLHAHLGGHASLRRCVSLWSLWTHKSCWNKSHPTCRLCFTQEHFMVSLGGLSRKNSYIRGGTWLCYGCFVVHYWCKLLPRAVPPTVLPCTPVLITYLFSQSLKGKFNLTMERVLVISASLLAWLMVYDFSAGAEKNLSHACIKTSEGERNFHTEWLILLNERFCFFFPWTID